MFYSAFEPGVNATGFGVVIPGRRASAADRHDQAIGTPTPGPKAAQPQLFVPVPGWNRRVPATLESGARSWPMGSAGDRAPRARAMPASPLTAQMPSG